MKRVRIASVAVALALVLVAPGCGGPSGDGEARPTTSFRYLVDPLKPGTGFVQLGQNRYPFEGVICASGPVKSDPEGSTRIFGVYANFEVDGALAAVSLTRYHNEVHGKIDTIPTVTDTALIQMQGKDEVRGLSAKRFQVVGDRVWQDPTDPNATKALITRSGDRYEAHGRFAPIGTQATEGSTTATGTVGEVAARCPDKAAPVTTDRTPG